MMASEENKQMSKTDLLWNELRVGIEQIYANKRHNSPKDQYMVMYQKVYRFCTASSQQSTPETYDAFDGTEFYEKLENFLETYVKTLRTNTPKLSGDPLLRHHINQWTDYKFSSRILNGICSYLNRHWIQLVRDSGNHRIHEIYNLCLVLWRKHYVRHFYESLNDRIIDMIRMERSGKNFNIKLVSDVLNSYLEIDEYNDDSMDRNTSGEHNESKLDETDNDNVKETDDEELAKEDIFYHLQDKEKDNNTDDNNNETENRKFYQIFETKFLTETEDHYSIASDKYLRKNSFLKYMKVVSKIYFEEERNVQLFLDERTLRPLMAICDKVLVVNHENAFIKAFEKLLKDDKKEDLCRLYGIVQRIPRIVATLEKLFGKHVKQEGLDAIEECGDKAMKNATLFVNAILTVHNTYETMIKEQFYRNKKLMIVLDKSCESFVNNNYLTRKPKDSRIPHQQNPPELPSYLLARHCDRVLSKNKSVPIQQISSQLNDVFLILNYIHDKDAFIKSYIHFFAKRLILQRSYSNDTEEKVLNDLKKFCHQDYMSKMQHMNADIVCSKQIRSDFIKFLAKTGIDSHRTIDIEFDILVLHSGSWPLEQLYTVKLPPEFDSNLQLFAKYYLKQHNSRLLNWLCTLSTGDLLTHCFDKQYRLLATVFEMCVLLQYNYGTQFTVKQLVDRTEMDRQMLLPLIDVMVNKFKLLSIVDNNNSDKSNTAKTSRAITDDNIVSLNTGFKSDKAVVNISFAVKSDSQNELTLYSTSEEDIKIRLQCLIIRIMKVKKTMKFRQLCAEVFPKFKPFLTTIEAIKAGVEILVEKDYMKLVDDKQVSDTYEYIP